MRATHRQRFPATDGKGSPGRGCSGLQRLTAFRLGGLLLLLLAGCTPQLPKPATITLEEGKTFDVVALLHVGQALLLGRGYLPDEERMTFTGYRVRGCQFDCYEHGQLRWTITTAARILGYNPMGSSLITERMEVIGFDEKSGDVTCVMQDLGGALKCFALAQIHLHRGEIEKAKALMDKSVIIIDSPDDQDWGPLNIRPWGTTRVTSPVDLAAPGVVPLGPSSCRIYNGLGVFDLEKRRGRWIITDAQNATWE